MTMYFEGCEIDFTFKGTTKYKQPWSVMLEKPYVNYLIKTLGLQQLPCLRIYFD